MNYFKHLCELSPNNIITENIKSISLRNVLTECIKKNGNGDFIFWGKGPNHTDKTYTEYDDHDQSSGWSEYCNGDDVSHSSFNYKKHADHEDHTEYSDKYTDHIDYSESMHNETSYDQARYHTDSDKLIVDYTEIAHHDQSSSKGQNIHTDHGNKEIDE